MANNFFLNSFNSSYNFKLNTIMKSKILIGLVITLALALFVETAYLLELKLQHKNTLDNNLQAYHPQNLFKFHSGYLDPLEEFNKIQGAINKSLNLSNDTGFKEYKNNYILRLTSPDIEKDKISIEVDGNSLVVSGEHNIQNEEKNKNGFYKKEQSFGSFRKMISLPQDANTDKLSTRYEDGTLVITIPKLKAVVGRDQSLQL